MGEPDDESREKTAAQAMAHDALVAHLASHPLGALLTPRRIDRMASVLQRRLTSVTLVLENLHDSHNVSAAIRSAEGFGIDTVHVVEAPNRFVRNHSILRGCDRWLSVRRHDRLALTLGSLIADGFCIAIADVGDGCVPVSEIPVDKKVAIVMGSEHEGLSRRAHDYADIRFTIPMQGFVESLNVSVSAAITLYDVTRHRRRALAQTGQLGEFSLDEMKLRGEKWLERTVRRPQGSNHRLRNVTDVIDSGDNDVSSDDVSSNDVS